MQTFGVQIPGVLCFGLALSTSPCSWPQLWVFCLFLGRVLGKMPLESFLALLCWPWKTSPCLSMNVGVVMLAWVFKPLGFNTRCCPSCFSKVASLGPSTKLELSKQHDPSRKSIFQLIILWKRDCSPILHVFDFCPSLVCSASKTNLELNKQRDLWSPPSPLQLFLQDPLGNSSAIKSSKQPTGTSGITNYCIGHVFPYLLWQYGRHARPPNGSLVESRGACRTHGVHSKQRVRPVCFARDYDPTISSASKDHSLLPPGNHDGEVVLVCFLGGIESKRLRMISLL